MKRRIDVNQEDLQKPIVGENFSTGCDVWREMEDIGVTLEWSSGITKIKKKSKNKSYVLSPWVRESGGNSAWVGQRCELFEYVEHIYRNRI